MLSMELPPGQIGRLRREMRQLGDKAPRAMSTAIRRSVKAIEGQIAKALGGKGGELNLTAKSVRERGMKTRFERQGTLTTGGTIRLSGRRVGLERFGARQTKKGVTYAIKRGGGRQTIKNAWIADPGVVKEGVAGGRRRSRPKPLGVGAKGAKGGGAFNVVMMRPDGVKRNPIAHARGPSIGHVALESGTVKRLSTETLGERLERETRGQIDRFLKQRRR